MRECLSKGERLKSKKFIEMLFEKGQQIRDSPLSLIYCAVDQKLPNRIQIAVSVSKNNFKSAVNRNKIKRRLREAYRLEKNTIIPHIKKNYIIMVIYQDKNMSDFRLIHSKMKKILLEFKEKIILIGS